MAKLVSSCLLIALLTALNDTAFAQSSISIPTPESPTREKVFTLSATLSTFTNLEENNSANDETGSTLEIKPSVRLTKEISLGANVGIEFDHITDESKLLNTQLLLVKDPIPLTPDLNLNLSAQALLPTDEVAREEATLRGAAGAIVGVRRKFALFGKEASAGYALNGLKSFHEYTRDNKRKANISHRLRQVVDLDVSVTTKMSVFVGGYWQTGWTYDNVVRENFSASQGIGYAFTDKFNVSLEHSTEGRAFAADGSEWDVKLYDKRDSTITVSLTGTY